MSLNEDELYSDELAEVPTIEVDRQVEVAEILVKEYKKILDNVNKLHNDAFIYAPESLEWASGDAMACVQGELEDQVKYLEDWLKYMKPYARRRHGT